MSVALGAMAAVLLFAPGTAEAHALLLRTEPATGVAVQERPSRVTLLFSEPVQVETNAVAVLDTDGHRVDLLDARADAERVDVSLPPGLPDGSYVVRWQVASADNHVVRGTAWFAVGFAVRPPEVAALVGTPAPSLPGLEIAGRWLVYLASSSLVGTWLFGVATRRPIAAPRALVVSAVAALALGQLAWVAAQIEAVSGVRVADALNSATLASVLESRFGALWSLRFIAGIGLAAMLRTRLAIVFSAGLLATLSLGSHAASGALPAAVGIPIDILHLGAASLWLGGLIQLIAGGRAQLLARARRLTPLALAAAGVLVVTGTASAWSDVASLGNLALTAYGQMLLAKVALVAAMVGIGGVNFMFVRRARTLPRAVLVELGLGGAILAATGVLTSLPPPGQQPAPGPVELTREADDLHVTFVADPDWIGESHFVVRLADASGDPPASVQSVTLTFAMQGMNMGRTNVLAVPSGAGAYAADGFYLGMPGIAEVGVGIQRIGQPDASATFPLDVPDIAQSRYAGLQPSLGSSVLGTSGFANPIPADSASLARGKSVFQVQCQTCHGATGVGDGPAAAALRPPPADLTLHARWHGDPQLFWFVSHGVTGTAMPSFSDLLTDTERWDVINYLHVLAEAPTATVQVSPATAAPVPAPAPIPTPTEIAPGSLGGRIVFGPDTDHDFWVIDLPDGAPRKITSFGALEFASSPAWSPSGRQIAYAFYELPANARIPLPPGTDIDVMDADGSNAHSLAGHDVPGAVLQNPRWGPDEDWLIVSYQGTRPDGAQDIGIDRLDIASGGRTRVVRNAIAPAVSRDGTQLAYALLPSGPTRGFTLWRSSIDGSAPVQLIGPNVFTRFEGVRFSPDGQHVVFAAVGNGQGYVAPSGLLDQLVWVSPAYADGDLWDVWMVDSDGRNLTRLTAINEDLPVLAWSPDGKAVAYLGGGSTVTAEAGVSILDTSGAALARLTRQPGHRGLDWTSR